MWGYGAGIPLGGPAAASGCLVPGRPLEFLVMPQHALRPACESARGRAPDTPPGGLPRPLTFVPLVNGPQWGREARVPQEPDGRPVFEVVVGGARYVAQQGVDGWEYVYAPRAD